MFGYTIYNFYSSILFYVLNKRANIIFEYKMELLFVYFLIMLCLLYLEFQNSSKNFAFQ